jgi:hypothetical protein
VRLLVREDVRQRLAHLAAELVELQAAAIDGGATPHIGRKQEPVRCPSDDVGRKSRTRQARSTAKYRPGQGAPSAFPIATKRSPGRRRPVERDSPPGVIGPLGRLGAFPRFLAPAVTVTSFDLVVPEDVYLTAGSGNSATANPIGRGPSGLHTVQSTGGSPPGLQYVRKAFATPGLLLVATLGFISDGAGSLEGACAVYIHLSARADYSE